MDKLDEMIAEALAEEERALVEQTAVPGFWRQILDLFRGRSAWVSWWTLIIEGILSVGAIWAGWQFFAAETALAAVKWGLPAFAAAVIVAVMEMSWLRALEADRVIRELKRVQLILAAREK